MILITNSYYYVYSKLIHYRLLKQNIPPLKETGCFYNQPVSRVLFSALLQNFYHLSGPAITDGINQPTHSDNAEAN